MATYVFRDGRFVDKKTGEPMPMPHRNEIVAPRYIIKDMPPHFAPDGKYVSGRAAYREALERTNCVPRDRMKNEPPKDRGFLNPAIARANGTTVRRDAVEKWKDDRAKAYAAADLPPPTN